MPDTTRAVVLIGETETEALRSLRERAATMPIDAEDAIAQCATAAGKRAHFAKMDKLTIPLGHYHLTFSIERQRGAMFRHLSISTDDSRYVPTLETASAIGVLLGFTRPPAEEPQNPHLGGVAFWLEALPGGGRALNMLQGIVASLDATHPTPQ